MIKFLCSTLRATACRIPPNESSSSQKRSDFCRSHFLTDHPETDLKRYRSKYVASERRYFDLISSKILTFFLFYVHDISSIMSTMYFKLFLFSRIAEL